MPMLWDVTKCINLSNKTKEIFFTNSGMIYNPFHALCNWLYQTKFDYSNRRRDSLLENNEVILTAEHIKQIIKDGLLKAVNPEEYNEIMLTSMLEEFIGLKVKGE